MNPQTLELQDKVEYQDTGKKGKRTGYIIEFDQDHSRARIRWTDRRPRTWIRTHALIKVQDKNNKPITNDTKAIS